MVKNKQFNKKVRRRARAEIEIWSYIHNMYKYKHNPADVTQSRVQTTLLSPVLVQSGTRCAGLPSVFSLHSALFFPLSKNKNSKLLGSVVVCTANRLQFSPTVIRRAEISKGPESFTVRLRSMGSSHGRLDSFQSFSFFSSRRFFRRWHKIFLCTNQDLAPQILVLCCQSAPSPTQTCFFFLWFFKHLTLYRMQS